MRVLYVESVKLKVSNIIPYIPNVTSEVSTHNPYAIFFVQAGGSSNSAFDNEASGSDIASTSGSTVRNLIKREINDRTTIYEPDDKLHFGYNKAGQEEDCTRPLSLESCFSHMFCSYVLASSG